jgi:hypothetical protein
MAYCTKCGKQNPDTAKFCTGCGALLSGSTQATSPEPGKIPEANGSNRSKKKGVAVWVLSVSVLLAAATAAYFIFFNKKTKKTENTASINTNPPKDATAGINSNDLISNQDDMSYTDGNGKLVFRSDCYIIVTGSFAEEYYARDYVQTMKNQGHNNTGYLWIPDYPSLSGKQFYATFIGPFATYSECENNLRYLKVNSRFWYGKKVSYNPEQIEIRIK